MLSVNMYSFIYIVLIVLIIIIIREKGKREKRNKREKNKGAIIKEKTFAKKVRTPGTLNRKSYRRINRRIHRRIHRRIYGTEVINHFCSKKEKRVCEKS